MAKPDLTVYRQQADGDYTKLSDNSGPYGWNGTDMYLIGAGAGGGGGGGDASAANQVTGNTSLASIDGKTPALSGGKVPITDPVTLPLPAGASTSALQTTGNTSLASVDGKLPALSGGKVPTTDPITLPLPAGASTSALQTTGNTTLASLQRETYTTVTITSVTTNASGATFTAFASLACTQLDIVNATGTTLEYRRGAAGTAFQIVDGSSRLIQGITNANQIDVRRTDTSNTQVTAFAEGFVV